MKKSPLSTPSGSRMKQRYGWKSHENNKRMGTGYTPMKNDRYSYQSSNGNERHYTKEDDEDDDHFIPLNVSSPLPFPATDQRRYYPNNSAAATSGTIPASGYRYNTDRNSFGFYNNRNSYHVAPKSHFGNSYSPYRNTANKQFHGQKKVYQKGMHRQVDISRYIDVKSSLEDPWEELTKQLNDSKESLQKTLSTNTSLIDSSSKSKLDSEINESLDISCEGSKSSEESINDSLCNTSVHVNDTDSSVLSQTSNRTDSNTNEIICKNKCSSLSAVPLKTEQEVTVNPKASAINVDRQSI